MAATFIWASPAMPTMRPEVANITVTDSSTFFTKTEPGQAGDRQYCDGPSPSARITIDPIAAKIGMYNTIIPSYDDIFDPPMLAAKSAKPRGANGAPSMGSGPDFNHTVRRDGDATVTFGSQGRFESRTLH